MARLIVVQVDRHIQRLDGDLLKHEEALSLGLRAGTLPSTDAQEAQTQALIDAQQRTAQQAGTTAAGGKGDLGLAPVPASKERSQSRESSRKTKKKGGDRKKGKKGVIIGHPVKPLPTLPAGLVPQPVDVSKADEALFGPADMVPL